MKRKSLLFLLLAAMFAPLAMNGQNTITLTEDMTQTIAPNTTYNFYDSGGPDSNYGTSQNYTATLTCVGNITINFSQFATESSSNCSDWDHMHIYDGNASTGTLLARGQTDCSTATLTTGTDYVATSGTMTIVWKSDGSSVAAGWAATITGGDAPSCVRPTLGEAEYISEEGASFQWTENGSATQWELQYSTDANFTNPTTINRNGIPAYAITGLNAATTYHVRVRANCGGGDLSDWSNVISFTTFAVAQNVGDGWADDFEGTSCGWELINGTLTNANWAWGTAVNNGGTHAIYISNDGGNNNAYNNSGYAVVFATKLLNFADGKYTFSYDWKCDGETSYDNLRVGLVPSTVELTAINTYDNTLPTGWVKLYDGDYLSEQTTWQTVEKTMQVTAGSYYVVLRWRQDSSGGDNPPAAVDNVSITRVTCPYDVTDLAVSDITSNSAILNWSTGEAEEWQVATKAVDGEWATLPDTYTSATAMLTGLTPATNYQVRVRAYCNANDQGTWCDPISFTTECEAIVTFPWSETFNDLTVDASIPNCWDNSEGTTTIASYKWSYNTKTSGNGMASNGHEGKCVVFNSYNNSNNLTNFLKTVSLSLPSDQLMQLSFWYKNPAGGDFSVYISTDGGATHETALATGLTGVTTWTEHPAISLAAYAGQEVVIVFKGTSNWGSGDAFIYLDDVTVMEVPSCMKPNDLEFVSATTTTATLSWTAGADETAWQICLNGDETNLIMANSNPFIVEDLTASTAYTAKVRAYCNTDDQSDWSNEVSFATQCEAIVVTDSWSEGFEDGDMPACWSQDGDATWTVGTGYNTNIGAHTGTYNAKITHSEDGNVTKLITPVLDLTSLNNPMLTFWYINLKWGIDKDAFAVYYRTASDAEWTLIESTEEAHENWTEATYTLPNSSATYQIAFEMTDGYGYGVGIDDVTIAEAPTYTKHITGYGTGTGNWYLIASPIGTIANSDLEEKVINIFSNSYDLFYFDQAKENEWVNYKPNESGEGNTSTHSHFGIEKGKGYLYANKYDVDLVFTGSAYTTSDGTETVQLAYTAGDGVDLPGWNLVGNPFAEKAYLEGNRGFYTMDGDGNFTPVTNASIESMEGIFVVADPEVEEDAVTFTTSEPTKGGNLALNLSNGRKAIDRAIVRFDGGRQLPKLQLFGERTKLYIPVEGQDYAIVSGEEMGELPVSFKAEENGTYSLSLSSEAVSFAYLHLIDNMTGADIDLLETPSYSFEAKTTDYANRFKLVFATGSSTGSETFAFFSNGSFVINNEGEATLQVVDVMGRIVKSESINGCANVSVNAAPGVYMLRLVNGDNMKVQKVVVK